MKNTFCALLIGLFSLIAFGQADKTAPKYDLTRPNPKTTAEINSMTRMQEGSEAWNTDTNTMWRYVNGSWIDTGTIPDGSITEAKLSTSVNTSLGLADSAIQPGDYPNLDTDSTDDVDIVSSQDVGGVKNFTDRISQSINGSVYLGNNVGISRTTATKNVGIGEDALSSATSAQGNVAIGSHAMDSLTTGLYNIAIGDNALATNTTNGVNIAIGADAMESALGAGLNVAIGNNTLKNTTSDYNTAVGHNVLTANTTGNYNVVTGTDAMTSNSSGSKNTVVGFNSMDGNTDGGENVAIGYNAGVGDGASQANANSSPDKSIYIGANSRPQTVNSINEIVIGDNAVGGGDNSATIGGPGITNTYLKGTVHGFAGIMEVNATSFNGNLTTTDTTIQKIADAVDGLAVSGSPGFSLPVHFLDTIYASGTPSTAYLTDARFENSLNTTLGGTVGQRKVIISADATYNHNIGTVLWFQSGGETSLIISPDTGVTGFVEFTLTEKTALVKRDSNVWNILVDPVVPATYSSTDITYDNTTSGLVGDTAQEAIDEVAAASIPLSSINKNADYTITGTEENRIIAATPALNDSIGFTTNDGVFTGPGFFTILNKGEGKIYLKQGTIPYQNGDWETPVGPGYRIKARIEHQDSIYVDPVGLVSHVETIAPLYDGQNAAGPDDINATTDFSITSGDATFSSISGDSSDGTYSVQLIKTVGTGTVEARIDLTSYLAYNTNYTITLDTKKKAQSFNYRYLLKSTGGWTADVNGTLLTGTTPATYTQESLTGTTAASGSIYLDIVMTSTTPINAAMLTDNIVITAN